MSRKQQKLAIEVVGDGHSLEIWSDLSIEELLSIEGLNNSTLVDGNRSVILLDPRYEVDSIIQTVTEYVDSMKE